MQSAHQTFITVGLSAAMVMGVAEASSAQTQIPSVSSEASGELASPAQQSLPLPSVSLLPAEQTIRYPGPISGNVAPVEGYLSAESGWPWERLLEFTSSPLRESAASSEDGLDVPAGSIAQPMGTQPMDAQPINVDAPILPSMGAIAFSKDGIETALPRNDVEWDIKDASDDRDKLEAFISYSGTIEDSNPSNPIDELYISQQDTPAEMEDESSEDITPQNSEETPSVSEDNQADESEMDDELPAEDLDVPEERSPRPSLDGLDIDVSEMDDDDNQGLVEIPDYMLAPSNPLFVPIEPETAQVEGTQPISLDQALEIAYRNSRELDSALRNLDQSQAALREQRASLFPTISNQTILTHSDLDLSDESSIIEGAEPNTVNTTLDFTVTLDYDIFTSGLRSANIRAAERAMRFQELQVEVVQEDIRLNITNAYYDLQETDEGVRIAQDTVNQSQISLRDAVARERAGVGTRFDRLQAEVELANDEQVLSNSLRNQQVARRQLAEFLSLPPGVDISASDPVEVAGAWAMPLEDTLVLAYRNRAELEQQLVQRELERQQRRAARAGRLPQLSAFASYDINDLLDVTRGPSPGDSETLSVGLRLDWTLFNGGASRARARQEAIAAELAEIQFADTREAIRFDVEEQYENLGANFKNIQTANSAVGLAEESLRLARLRFGAGVGIQSDVLEAQTQLTEAEVNLVTAILDYNRALVAIQRAVGNFPDNNLSADPARE